MITSLSLLLLVGLFFGHMFKTLRLPSLLGMIVTGMVLGPYALNTLDPALLNISPDLRQLALIVILTRAGLSLDLADLKLIGRPALLMSFLPALAEIAGVVLLAPLLFGLSLAEAAMLGSVMAAVSPAVIVPRMIGLMDQGYGRARRIPQLILAGASVDDVVVIVLFSAFATLAGGGRLSALGFVGIPMSIATGTALGALAGLLLLRLFAAYHIRDTVKVLMILSLSGLLLELEARVSGIVPFSGLLAVMAIGITLNQIHPALAKRLSKKYNKIWVAAEIILFALVGAAVDLRYAVGAGVAAVTLVAAALVFRLAGVGLSLRGTSLTPKERLFCMMAYLPKATVQAAIGGIPLAMGFSSGPLILSVAVVSILLTAPLGALMIDGYHDRLLERA